MKISPRSALLAAVATGATTLLAASPASAAINDDFHASTTDGCGVVNFIDYGPGSPGGGDNDDYAVVHDRCSDGHGVIAYTSLNGKALGSVYNGNGLAGAPVIWDPYKARGNVDEGDEVTLEVCLVDGASDPTPSRCGFEAYISHDG